MSFFTVRPMIPTDEPFVIWTWLTSYARSRYGRSVGAYASSREDVDPAKLEAYRDDMRCVVTRIIAQPDTLVDVAVDAEDSDVIWGWSCTTGDTIHYVLAKRKLHQNSAEVDTRGIWTPTLGLSGEVYRGLLGDRFQRPCPYTSELVDMRRPELRAQGVTLPSSWYLDPLYFARRTA